FSLNSCYMNSRPGRAIEIQTYEGTGIPNFIDPDPSPQFIALCRRSNGMTSLMRARVTILGPPTGRYNCHGLVFGCRRTNIPPGNQPDAVNVDDLLRRDEYNPVASPQVGDIIIYRSTSGEI